MNKVLKTAVQQELNNYVEFWSNEQLTAENEKELLTNLFNHFSTEYFYENSLLNLQDFFTQYIQNNCYCYNDEIISIMINRWGLSLTDKNGCLYPTDKSVHLFGYYMFVCFRDLLKKNNINIFNLRNKYDGIFSRNLGAYQA